MDRMNDIFYKALMFLKARELLFYDVCLLSSHSTSSAKNRYPEISFCFMNAKTPTNSLDHLLHWHWKVANLPRPLYMDDSNRRLNISWWLGGLVICRLNLLPSYPPSQWLMNQRLRKILGPLLDVSGNFPLLINTLFFVCPLRQGGDSGIRS